MDSLGTINYCILAIEIILLVIGVLYITGKKTAIKTFLYVGSVFLVTLLVYSLPTYYVQYQNEKTINFTIGLFGGIGQTLRQFVGESDTENIYAYTKDFSIYSLIFALSAVMAIVTTGYATISIFRRTFFNDISRARRLKKDYCDVFVGCGENAVNYAKRNKNAVLLIDEGTEKGTIVSLIDDECVVMKGKLSVKFLKSRWFKKKTRYNIILSGEKNLLHKELGTVFECVSSVYQKKNIYFYVEIDEKTAEMVQHQIDIKQKLDGIPYREYITLFSLNELVARKFVEENPVTRYIPENFLKHDTSLKKNARINVLMVGFGARNKELYKKFVINNQLTVRNNDEYGVFPLNYFIYDADVDKKIWEIDGLKHALEKLKTSEEEYFPIPELPYNTECYAENLYDLDSISNACEKMKKESGFSFIIIDTEDVYRNIEISNSFNLLLNNGKDYRIFMYSNFPILSDKNIICYGETDKLLTHDVIIHESLLTLAKVINKEYLKQWLDPEGKMLEKDIEEENKKDWKNASYFNVYSNISLAVSMRLKLNLLGLDYCISGNNEKKQSELIKEHYGIYDEEATKYENYFTESRRNALLAQEHYRWNAYHLLNGYLPMKKARIAVKKSNTNNDEIEKIIKNNSTKKHSALTTFSGLNNLSVFLAGEANKLLGKDAYSSADFDLYQNDELLMKVVGKFAEDNNYCIEKK